MTFKEPNVTSKNTIQQDLFLLTKGHYMTHRIDRFTAAKIILSVHVIAMEYIRLQDIVFWFVKEFYDPGIILKNRTDVSKLVVNPGSIHSHSNPRPSFQELLLHELMDQVSTLYCFKSGQWLMPFERPTPDPKVQEFFDSYAKHHDLLLPVKS